MILTEDEAKTKWCQESQAAFYIGTTLVFANRDVVHKPNPHPNTLCLGSACMAWRQETKSSLINKKTGEVRPVVPGEVYLASDWRCGEQPTGRGYCGKAGKP